MAGVWIQLKTARTIYRADGTPENKQPGNWVQIGKAQAREWIADGSACIPDETKHRAVLAGDLKDCGVSVRVPGVDAKPAIGRYELAVSFAGIALPYVRTLVWHPEYALLPDQSAYGFTKLEVVDEHDTWEMAAILTAGDMTMGMVGSEADRQGTQKLIGTLDVPVYESRAVWLRRTGNTEKMVMAWAELLAQGVGEEHAFLRALYATAPLTCTLKPGWMRNWYEEEQRALEWKRKAAKARKRVKGRVVQAAR